MSSAATILVVNCNTDTGMTSAIAAIARRSAREGTRIVGLGPAWGPSSAEGYVESFATAMATIDAVLSYKGHFDAVVMAGYGEHGREGMRQSVRQPVVDITEASAYLACLVGHRYGVVTTVRSAVAGIHDSLRSASIDGRCVGVAASNMPVSHIADSQDAALTALLPPARSLIAAGADAIVLGCAGFAGLDRALEGVLGIPFIDGVAAAVAVAESLVALGKSTSAGGPFAPADPTKSWSGPRPGALGAQLGLSSHLDVA